MRKKRISVEALQDSNGSWVLDQDALKGMARNFFIDLYSRDPQISPDADWPVGFPQLSREQLHFIQREVSEEEVKRAVFEMGPSKAPGPDGITAGFIQKHWQAVHKQVYQVVLEAFQNPESIREVNLTHIVLIPKVDAPAGLRDFRPISLCNVCYKIISKVLANRIKGVMSFLVKENQCSFVGGRQSCDNIIIAQEAIHTMRTKRSGSGFVAIKVDMEKAYDRLDWGFLYNTLCEIGFASRFIDIIMACVRTATMKVCWNGQASAQFIPSRGVRQGDPISPYLFVLCMEKLSHLISWEVQNRKWKPMRMRRNGPQISHLFFADDLVLFCEASQEQMAEVKRVMTRFCAVSGHNVNMQKTRAFVSKRVHANRAMEPCRSLGISIAADLGKYLGVPLLHKRVTKVTFSPLVQNVQRKLAGWKGRFLSMAGRTALIRSMLMAIPYYQMQTLLLPKGVLGEIEQVCRNFLWNQGEHTRTPHLVAWENVKRPKDAGGLGIKDLHLQNVAFIMKLCWRLLTKPRAL